MLSELMARGPSSVCMKTSQNDGSKVPDGCEMGSTDANRWPNRLVRPATVMTISALSANDDGIRFDVGLSVSISVLPCNVTAKSDCAGVGFWNGRGDRSDLADGRLSGVVLSRSPAAVGESPSFGLGKRC